VSQRPKEVRPASTEPRPVRRGEGLSGALLLGNWLLWMHSKPPETYKSVLMIWYKYFLVGPAILEAGPSQEIPEQLVSMPTCPSLKLHLFFPFFKTAWLSSSNSAAGRLPAGEPLRSCCTACSCSAFINSLPRSGKWARIVVCWISAHKLTIVLAGTGRWMGMRSKRTASTAKARSRPY